GKRPIRQAWAAHRTVGLVQVLPDFVEVVQVPAQPEAGAGALECLGSFARAAEFSSSAHSSPTPVWDPRPLTDTVETTTTLAQMTLCFCPLPPLLSVRSKFCATWTLYVRVQPHSPKMSFSRSV